LNDKTLSVHKFVLIRSTLQISAPHFPIFHSSTRSEQLYYVYRR